MRCVIGLVWCEARVCVWFVGCGAVGLVLLFCNVVVVRFREFRVFSLVLVCGVLVVCVCCVLKCVV